MKNGLPLVSLPHNHFLVHYFLWENYFLLTSTFLVHSQGIQQGWRVVEIGQFSRRAQEQLCPFTICSQGTADARYFEGVRQPEPVNWCTRQAHYMERSPWDWEIPRTCPYAKPHKCTVLLLNRPQWDKRHTDCENCVCTLPQSMQLLEIIPAYLLHRQSKLREHKHIFVCYNEKRFPKPMWPRNPTWGLENEGTREKQTELISTPQNCHIIMLKGTYDFLWVTKPIRWNVLQFYSNR